MSGLKISGLSTGYGKIRIVSDVSLPAVGGGTIIGLLGPNGAGKSTFLRALAGLLDFEGEVQLNDHDLAAITHQQRVKRIGYLPQALPQATTLVAYEAVMSAYRAIQPDVGREVAEQAVEATFNRLGIRDLAFKPLAKLSGGQRQIIGLAQVAVRKPVLPVRSFSI